MHPSCATPRALPFKLFNFGQWYPDGGVDVEVSEFAAPQEFPDETLGTLPAHHELFNREVCIHVADRTCPHTVESVACRWRLGGVSVEFRWSTVFLVD